MNGLRGEALRKFIARKGLFGRRKLPDSLKPVEPEVKFGRAVLDRAILDTLVDPNIKQWFSVENEAFTDMCFIAQLEAEIVQVQVSVVLTKLHDKPLMEENSNNDN